MNKSKLLIISAIVLITAALSLHPVTAADSQGQRVHRFEYATLRWAGRDNTHIIRPSGEVEFVGAQLSKIQKPSHTDDRSFYLNILMNALAKEGYEFVGISNDDIVMKRAIIEAK